MDFLAHFQNEDAYLPLTSIVSNLHSAYGIVCENQSKAIADLAIPWYENILMNMGLDPDENEKQTISMLRDQLIWHACLYGSRSVAAFARKYMEALMNGGAVHADIAKSVMQVGALNGDRAVYEWLDQQFETEAVKRQKEIDNGEKLVVGVNIFTEDEEKETPLGAQRIPENSVKQQIEGVKKLKRTRDMNNLKDAIERLRDDAGTGKNVIPAMVDATNAFGTTAELLGTVREVFGYPYDPLNIIESPFS